MHKMFTDLPADIVDRILTFLTDFKTLSAAIRTSKKHVYEVFQAHPKSIVLSIAYNIVGQALPHAVTMLDRTTKGGELEGETNADDDDNKVPDIADESATNDIQLSRKTADRLAFHAKVTWDLEDLYSLWNKDRTSIKTVLSVTESYRFHRAMYRYWTSTTLGDMDDVEGYEQELIKFYKQIRTQELYEVKNVMGFLEEVAIWLCCAVNDVEEDNSARSAISGGPDIILEAYKLLDVTGFYGTDGSALLFSEALESTWQSRKIKLNDVTEKTAKAILDNVNGEKDECARCNSVAGVKLWGVTNGHLLPGFHPRSALYPLLGGRLNQNQVEIPALRNKLWDAQESDWNRFIEELMDLNSDTGETWDKTEWYCDQCIIELLRQRLRKWWIQEKIKDGTHIQEDCWYGYNCRTQVHRMAHAERLNHLCEPTRGQAS